MANTLERMSRNEKLNNSDVWSYLPTMMFEADEMFGNEDSRGIQLSPINLKDARHPGWENARNWSDWNQVKEVTIDNETVDNNSTSGTSSNRQWPRQRLCRNALWVLLVGSFVAAVVAAVGLSIILTFYSNKSENLIYHGENLEPYLSEAEEQYMSRKFCNLVRVLLRSAEFPVYHGVDDCRAILTLTTDSDDLNINIKVIPAKGFTLKEKIKRALAEQLLVDGMYRINDTDQYILTSNLSVISDIVVVPHLKPSNGGIRARRPPPNRQNNVTPRHKTEPDSKTEQVTTRKPVTNNSVATTETGAKAISVKANMAEASPEKVTTTEAVATTEPSIMTDRVVTSDQVTTTTRRTEVASGQTSTTSTASEFSSSTSTSSDSVQTTESRNEPTTTFPDFAYMDVEGYFDMTTETMTTNNGIKELSTAQPIPAAKQRLTALADVLSGTRRSTEVAQTSITSTETTIAPSTVTTVKLTSEPSTIATAELTSAPRIMTTTEYLVPEPSTITATESPLVQSTRTTNVAVETTIPTTESTMQETTTQELPFETFTTTEATTNSEGETTLSIDEIRKPKTELLNVQDNNTTLTNMVKSHSPIDNKNVALNNTLVPRKPTIVATNLFDVGRQSSAGIAVANATESKRKSSSGKSMIVESLMTGGIIKLPFKTNSNFKFLFARNSNVRHVTKPRVAVRPRVMVRNTKTPEVRTNAAKKVPVVKVTNKIAEDGFARRGNVVTNSTVRRSRIPIIPKIAG